MKLIKPAYEIATKILGIQNAEEPLEWSNFCLKVPCEDGVLVYNTLTGELRLLDHSEADSIETNNIVKQTLAEHYYLLNKNTDGYLLASQFKRIAKLLKKNKPGFEKYTIFTTTDCNARCSYCYELGRRRISMSDKTAHDAAAFIINNSTGSRVKIQWFGGEPLFNLRAIDIITGDLRDNDVEFSSIMVSNGYLFDKDLAERAVRNWKLDFVQIAMDGTERSYNEAKNYIYKEGNPYRKVFRNIGILLDAGIRVEIRLNMDGKNADDLEELAHLLIDQYGGRDGFGIYTVLLKDFGHSFNKFQTEEDALRAYEKLQTMIINAGVFHALKLPEDVRGNQCMADNDNSITILPDGRIGKCEHESEKDFIGSIYDDQYDEKMIRAWQETISVDECKTCLFYPTCIRLRKCAWNNDSCTEMDRKEMKFNITQNVLKEYRAFKSKEMI